MMEALRESAPPADEAPVVDSRAKAIATALEARIVEMKAQHEDTAGELHGWKLQYKRRVQAADGSSRQGDIMLTTPEGERIFSIVRMRRKLGLEASASRPAPSAEKEEAAPPKAKPKKAKKEASAGLSDRRAATLAKLASSLAPGADEPDEAACQLAAEIEEEMDARLGSASKEYAGKGRSIVFNLAKNAELRANVLEGVFSTEALVSATARDLAPEALKAQREASATRYAAQRSLGQTDEHVVGWQAGTTGQLEWSHKYEKEQLVSGGEAGWHAQEELLEQEEAEAMAAFAEPDEASAAHAAEAEGAPSQAELTAEAGMADVEADDLFDAPPAPVSSRKAAAAPRDHAAPAAGADGRVSPAAADADSGPLGDSLGVDFIDDDGALDDDAAEAHRGLKRGRGEEPGSGPRSAYVGSLVRACTLAEAAPGALRAPTAPEAEAKRLLCLGALGRLQSLVQRWKKGPLQPF